MWLIGVSGAIGNSGCLPCGLIWSIMLCNNSEIGLSNFLWKILRVKQGQVQPFLGQEWL